MELRGHEPGMVRQLDDLHQPPVGGQPAEHQPVLGQPVPEGVVELVPVPVALQNLCVAVRLVGAGALFQHAGIGA